MAVSSVDSIAGSESGSPIASENFRISSGTAPWNCGRTTTRSWLALYSCAMRSIAAPGRPISVCHRSICTGPSAGSTSSSASTGQSGSATSCRAGIVAGRVGVVAAGAAAGEHRGGDQRGHDGRPTGAARPM